MVLSVDIAGGGTLDLDLVSVNGNSCLLGSSQCAEVEISVSSPLEFKGEVNPSDYEAVLFYKKNWKESEIFQLYDADTDARFGWIFPIQALGSDQHDYVENPHFCSYAEAAFALLCRGEFGGRTTFPPHSYPEERADLTRFFREGTYVAVASCEAIKRIHKFSWKKYLPAFFSLGYVLRSKQDPGELAWEWDIITLTEDRKRLNLSPLVEECVGFRYLDSLLVNVLPYERDPLVQFFHVYQLVELLLELVFVSEQSSLVARLIRGSSDVTQVKELLEEWKDLAKEKKRLKLMETNYVSRSSVETDFRQACNSFLEANERAGGECISAYLYNTRNLLFHSLRSMNPDSGDKLREINKYFIRYVCDSLTSFGKKQCNATPWMT